MTASYLLMKKNYKLLKLWETIEEKTYVGPVNKQYITIVTSTHYTNLPLRSGSNNFIDTLFGSIGHPDML